MSMNTTDQWHHEEKLIEYLAQQLIKGRLGLFLGAGISQFYGLPSWTALVDKLCEMNGEAKLSSGDDVIVKAGSLRRKHYDQDPDRFKRDLKRALYDGVTLDFAKLRLNETLAAIGSLVMSSRRGSASKVFTLNYDDLLENYLEFHGFTTASISQGRHWEEDEDVVIYHPHGFLPLSEKNDSAEVILGTADYHEIMNSPLWRPLLETTLRTHTFLYIGLSGVDTHLQSLLSTVKDRHAINEDRTRYSGVRFGIEGKDDDIGVVLEGYDVFTHVVTSHDDIPKFLFKICQAARDIRLAKG